MSNTNSSLADLFAQFMSILATAGGDAAAAQAGGRPAALAAGLAVPRQQPPPPQLPLPAPVAPATTAPASAPSVNSNNVWKAAEAAAVAQRQAGRGRPVLQALRQRETTGRTLAPASQLYMASLKLEGLQRGDARLVLHLLKLLEDALVAPTHFGRLSMNAIDSTTEVMQALRLPFVQAFLSFHGVTLIARLFIKMCKASCSESGLSAEDTESFVVKAVGLMKFMSGNLEAAEVMAANDELIAALFPHMRTIFDLAGSLIEEILAVRITPFDLRKVGNLYEISSKMNLRQFSFFCKILMLLCFDPKERLFGIVDPSDNNDYQQPIVLPSQPRIVDINISITIGIPNLMPMLRNLMKMDYLYLPKTHIKLNDTPAITSYLSYLERALVQLQLNEDEDEYDDTLEDVIHIVREQHDNHPSDLSAKTVIISIFASDTVFLLSTILKSKRRLDFLSRMIHHDFLTILSDFADHIEWDAPKYPPDEHLMRLHGPSCDCNADTTIKTHFSRLVHSMCKVPTSTINFIRLQEVERETVGKSFTEAQRSRHTPHGLTWCGNDKSLVTRLIKIFIATADDAPYKMWVSNAIETFLRGCDPSDQMLVYNHGLLEHVTAEFVRDVFQTCQQIQSNFDLLGEMIKFNKFIVTRFLRLLSDKMTAKFVQTVEANVIDSNVFMRSLVLTFDKLEREDDLDEFIIEHPLFQYVREHWANFASMCMRSITVAEITQENISCMNTALCLCILETRRPNSGGLDGVLKAIGAASDAAAAASDVKTPALDNFAKLLRFWLTTYLKRVRDCLALEQMSQIPLKEWKRNVDDILKHLSPPKAV